MVVDLEPEECEIAAIITQATEQRSIHKLRLAGADRVVSPYRIAGHGMASVLDAAHLERTGLRLEENVLIAVGTNDQLHALRRLVG